jgi:hypothetical protein
MDELFRLGALDMVRGLHERRFSCVDLVSASLARIAALDDRYEAFLTVAVETFFSTLTRRRLKRGVFRSIVDLQAAINRYLAEHNQAPRPFTWTRSADAILDRLTPIPAPSV